MDQLIDVAGAQKDHLSPFPSFHHFNCGGMGLLDFEYYKILDHVIRHRHFLS